MILFASFDNVLKYGLLLKDLALCMWNWVYGCGGDYAH